MNILMKDTRRISEDGHTVKRLEAGQEYDVAQEAASSLVRKGHATLFDCFRSSDPLEQIAAMNRFAADIANHD